MIDPNDSRHQNRLSSALQYWFRQHEQYRQARRETIINISGSNDVAGGLWQPEQGIQNKQRPWGNLLQMAYLAHVIQLAYNEPRYTVISNVPQGDGIAPRLEEFLKRYSNLLSLGNIARNLAADSFSGWGIAKVARGMLPPGARFATGQAVGPMCWRISQDNFIFDGTATSWDYVSFAANTILVPLNEAQNFQPFLAYNPDDTKALQEFSMTPGMTDAKIHSNPMSMAAAVPMVRLLQVFLPYAGASGLMVTWPDNGMSFAGVNGKPLLVEEHNGHHTGPFSVLSHLDVPDNLVQVAQCESVKQLHFLYNDIAQITAEQARAAKVVPIYQMGSQRDMQRLEQAQDRTAVAVTNIDRISMWELPGPTQSQTAAQMGTYQLFKELAGNVDDTLGLGQTAPTATQSALIRQQTNARSAEARRRMDSVMELIARKLSHLLLNDQDMQLPMRRPLPGFPDIQQDVSWYNAQQMPRNPSADDYLITIVPGSMSFRDPAERLASLNEAISQIVALAQAVAQGLPAELEKFVDIQARYRDLPELRDLFLGLLPELQAAKQAAQAQGGGMPDPTKGQYTRTNVSAQTNQGALQQNMTQTPSDNTPVRGGMIRV